MPLVVRGVAVLLRERCRIVAQRRLEVLRLRQVARIGVRRVHLPLAAQSLGQLQLEAVVDRVVDIAHVVDLIEEEVVDVQVGPVVRDAFGRLVGVAAWGRKGSDVVELLSAHEAHVVVDVPVLQLLAVSLVDVRQLDRHLGSDLALEPHRQLVGIRCLHAAIDL